MRRLLLIVAIMLTVSSAAFGKVRLLDQTGSTVTMQWDVNPVADNVTGYNVYRENFSREYDTGAAVRLNSGGPINSTVFTDVTVQRGHTYFYVVTAVNATGESGASNEIRADIPNVVPSPPKGLHIVNVIASFFRHIGRGLIGRG